MYPDGEEDERMTKCPGQKDLQRFADGELTGRRRSRFAEHLEGCQQCAEELRQIRKIGELVSGAIRNEAERHDLTGLWERVSVGIASAPPTYEAWRWVLTLLWKPPARVAYAAAILLLVGFLAFRPFLPDMRPPRATGEAQVYSVHQYDPHVTVSVLLASGGKSAIVWISGVEPTEEN